MTKTKLTALVLVLFFIGGFAVFKFNSIQNQKFERVALKTSAITEAVYGLGTVVPRQVYRLKVGIQTTVRKVWARQGAEVKAGDPLLELTDTGRVRAPFAGTVTQLFFDEGENVFPQMTILSLEDLNSLYLQVSLEQQGVLRVKKGLSVKLAFESLRGQKLNGKVSAIYPVNGQFFVNIDSESFPPGVLPGMTADVAIEVSQKENVSLIPVAALKNGKIWIEGEDSKPKLIQVEIGVMDGEWAELKSPNLPPSTVVLIQKRK